jgi:hypothetical protein
MGTQPPRAGGAGGHGFRGQEAGINEPGQVVPGAGRQPVFPQAGIPAVRAGLGPGRNTPPRRPRVRPPCGPAAAGAAVTRTGAPVPVGWDKRMSEPEPVQSAPLSCGSRQRLRRGLRLQDGPGTAEAGTALAWLGWGGRAIPSPSARRGLADHPRPVQVVRPAGRSTCTGREWPAPRRVADGDGMTRPGQECAYAPRKTTGTCKTQGNRGDNGRSGRKNNCRPEIIRI